MESRAIVVEVVEGVAVSKEAWVKVAQKITTVPADDVEEGYWSTVSPCKVEHSPNKLSE